MHDVDVVQYNLTARRARSVVVRSSLLLHDYLPTSRCFVLPRQLNAAEDVDFDP